MRQIKNIKYVDKNGVQKYAVALYFTKELLIDCHYSLKDNRKLIITFEDKKIMADTATTNEKKEKNTHNIEIETHYKPIQRI